MNRVFLQAGRRRPAPRSPPRLCLPVPSPQPPSGSPARRVFAPGATTRTRGSPSPLQAPRGQHRVRVRVHPKAGLRGGGFEQQQPVRRMKRLRPWVEGSSPGAVRRPGSHLYYVIFWGEPPGRASWRRRLLPGTTLGGDQEPPTPWRPTTPRLGRRWRRTVSSLCASRSRDGTSPNSSPAGAGDGGSGRALRTTRG
jgi:hypothetical protein